jgi:hypothetical protein
VMMSEGIITYALQYLVKSESYYYCCLRKYCANDFLIQYFIPFNETSFVLLGSM